MNAPDRQRQTRASATTLTVTIAGAALLVSIVFAASMLRTGTEAEAETADPMAEKARLAAETADLMAEKARLAAETADLMAEKARLMEELRVSKELEGYLRITDLPLDAQVQRLRQYARFIDTCQGSCIDAVFQSVDEESRRAAHVLVANEAGAQSEAMVHRTGNWDIEPRAGEQVKFTCKGKFEDLHGLPNYYDCFLGSARARWFHEDVQIEDRMRVAYTDYASYVSYIEQGCADALQPANGSLCSPVSREEWELGQAQATSEGNVALQRRLKEIEAAEKRR